MKAILTHRGIGGLGGCDSCTEGEESISHVLRDCPTAKMFWEKAYCPVSLKLSFSDDLLVWIRKNALDSQRGLVKIMTGAIFSCLDYGICGFNRTERHLSSSLPIQI